MALNGTLKKAKKPQANGYADTKMNGHYGKADETRSTKQQRRPRRTYKAALVNTSARLLLYYAVLTSLFRCPSSLPDLTDGSPRICKPYLQLRSYAAPYVEPYYTTYLASYVETARPYVDTVNQKAFTPAAQFTKQNYEIYGAPRVEQVQLYAQGEWDRSIKPQLDIVKGEVWHQYSAHVHPYVSTATDAVGPYYETASKTAVDQYYSTLLPTYKTVLPYAQQGYSFGHYYTTKIIFPYARWTEATLRSFLARTVWPRLRVLYGDNVEPQLMRISERLGRYKDSKKLEAVVDAVESSAITSTVSTELSSHSVAESLTISNEATTTSSSVGKTKPTYDAAEAREKIANDLRTWQEKFAAAADKGSDDLEERVEEITKSQIRKQAHGVGKALVVELDEASKSATQDVRSKIQTIVQGLPEDPTEAEANDALESAIDAIRSAGLLVKQKAMAVRGWKQNYDKETYNLVHDASSSTLDVIDNIRDLGLQEIGMRWAWMDGVTYKDWQKYHKLKKTFDEWRNEVQARAYEHTGLASAKAEGQKQEDEAMDIASSAAAELGRLKNSAKWKIWAQDSTDDFSDRKIPPRVFKASQSISSKVVEASESIIGTQQGSIESVASVASEKLDNASSRISSGVVGKETGSVESAASQISEAVIGSQGVANSAASVVSDKAQSVAASASQQGENAASKASSAIVGSQDSVQSISSVAEAKASSIASEASSIVLGTQNSAESVSSVLSDKAEKAASKVSEAVASSQGTIESVASKASEAVAGSQGTIESLSSVASKNAQSVVSAAHKKAEQATDSIKGSPPPIASQASSSAESIASVVSEAAESPKKVWGGAVAQKVSARQPILDDVFGDDEDESYSAKLQSLLSDAGDKASEITDAINDALSRATATNTVGSVESAKSLAGEQYEKVFSVVSTVLYGTAQGTGESISSVASENYAAAVTAASYAIYGTPAPILSSLSSQAAASYSAAIAAAGADYEKAKSIVSEQMSGGKTEKRFEVMLSSAEKIYSDSIAAASIQWQAASQAVRPTQAPLESVSSVASSRLSEGLSLASAQYTSAKIAAGLQPTPATQQYLAEARRRYYEGIGQAHARYSEFVEEASGAIYGTPTPVYESVISAAQSQYTAALNEASSKLQNARDAFSSQTKGAAENLLDIDATSHFNAALAAATEALSGASAKASEAIYGPPQGAAESIASQLSQQVEHAASVASSSVIGTETLWTESVASQASANWESLVSRASEQVYGEPTPFTESLLSQAGAYGSQAGAYGAQATEAAAAQYASIQALISELVIGKEPSFTESVLSRFNSAYPTGYPALASSASSYASDAYASASSVITSVFTPPPALDAILDSANEQLNAAVDAMSAQIYGTEKGYLEKASEAAGSAYDAAQTKASEAVYGTQGSYAEQAQASLVDVAASAQSAISIAFYGTPTGTVESATDAAAVAYASVQSVLSENIRQAGDVAGDSYEAARARISSAVYGPEAGALESAQARVAAAVESAKARLSELAAAGGEQAEKAKESLEEIVEQVAEAASSVTARVKDEL